LQAGKLGLGAPFCGGPPPQGSRNQKHCRHLWLPLHTCKF